MSGPESDLQHQGIAMLESAGAGVLVFSQDRKTRKQERGVTDVVAFFPNKTAWIEFKAKGKKLRPSQEKFAAFLAPFLGPNLVHAVVDDLGQLQAVIILLTADYSDEDKAAMVWQIMRSEDRELDAARGGE